MSASRKGISLYFLIGIVVAVGAYLFGAFRSNAYKAALPSLEKGVLDATDWLPLKNKGPLTLDGEWEIYYNQLLEPEDIAAQPPANTYFTLPGEIIHEARVRDAVDFEGYATLRAVIKLKSPDPQTLYGIRTRYLSSSSKIYVNGAVVASAGIVSSNPESYRAQYAPMEAFFTTQTKDVEIVIQIANFHHRRVQLDEIWFGTKQGILQHAFRSIIEDSLLTGCLLVISLCFIIFYVVNNRNRTALWLSVIAFFAAMRGSIVSERILIRLAPNFSPEWMMKFGYLPTFILLPLFVLYFRYLFRAARLDKLSKALGAGMVLSCLLVFLTDIKVYDLVFEYTQWIVAAVGVYMIYVVLADKLITKTRDGMYVLVGGCAVLLAAVNDMLREFNVLHTPEMLTLAAVLFIVPQAIYLGWKLNDSYVQSERLAYENERMVSEIQTMNVLLENKVQSRTRELELANTQLEMLARIDPLTQLANRRWFDERLEAEWANSKKEGKNLTLLMIDIDFFKNFNDTYGHIAGDECLQAIATELKRCVRSGIDIVARYGGEEFVALLSETSLETGIRVANRMRKTVEELLIPNKASAAAEVVTVSIGICSVAAWDVSSIHQLIGKADKALYKAKENGRNRVELDERGEIGRS